MGGDIEDPLTYAIWIWRSSRNMHPVRRNRYGKEMRTTTPKPFAWIYPVSRCRSQVGVVYGGEEIRGRSEKARRTKEDRGARLLGESKGKDLPNVHVANHVVQIWQRIRKPGRQQICIKSAQITDHGSSSSTSHGNQDLADASESAEELGRWNHQYAAEWMRQNYTPPDNLPMVSPPTPKCGRKRAS